MRVEDRSLFLARLRELVEKGEKALSREEAAEHFSDMQLTDEQMEQVLSYLRSNGVTILEPSGSSGREAVEGLSSSLSRLLKDSERELSLPASEKNRAALKEYLQELKALPQLSAEEDRKLSDAYLAGDEQAAGKLAQGNLQLSFLIAKEYFSAGSSAGPGSAGSPGNSRRKEYSPDFYDLIQEGNLGLYTALSRYTGAGGLSFQEYASLWIRQSVLTVIARSERESGFADRIVQILNRIRDASDDIARDLGEEPTASELAQYLEIPPAKVEQALAFAKDSKIEIGVRTIQSGQYRQFRQSRQFRQDRQDRESRQDREDGRFNKEEKRRQDGSIPQT